MKKASSWAVTVPGTLSALLFHTYLKSFSEQSLLFTDDNILKEDWESVEKQEKASYLWAFVN